MKFMFLYYLFLYSTSTITLTILYEKIIDKELEKLYLQVLRTVIDRYNILLSKSDIELKLEDMLSIKSYSNKPQYKNFSKYAGTNDLNRRMNTIENIKGNIIVISSVSYSVTEDIFYHMENPCLSKYITAFSFNMRNDTVVGIMDGVQKWLTRLIGVEMPGPFDSVQIKKMNEILEKTKKSRIKSLARECRRNEDEIRDQFKSLSTQIDPTLDENGIPPSSDNDVQVDELARKVARMVISSKNSKQSRAEYNE